MQHQCAFSITRSTCMSRTDAYSRGMQLRTVREALRLLRLQAGLGLDEVEGLNRATVHRIESVRRDPEYSPELSSVIRIIEACGITVAEFFMMLDDVKTAESAGGLALLSELRDAKVVRQMQAFL